MNFNWVNSSKSYKKQADKIIIEVRLSRLTILELNLDWSRKEIRFIFFNFGFEIKPSIQN